MDTKRAPRETGSGADAKRGGAAAPAPVAKEERVRPLAWSLADWEEASLVPPQMQPLLSADEEFERLKKMAEAGARQPQRIGCDPVRRCFRCGLPLEVATQRYYDLTAPNGRGRQPTLLDPLVPFEKRDARGDLGECCSVMLHAHIDNVRHKLDTVVAEVQRNDAHLPLTVEGIRALAERVERKEDHKG